METKAFIDFMTVFISQVSDKQHRQQLEYALARTQALTTGDVEGACILVPPAPLSRMA